MASVTLEHIDKKYPNGFHAVKDFNLDIKDILLTTSYFGQILKEMGTLYLFIPSTILGKISGILFYYLCISIGNLFNTNKVRMGFVAYFTIQAILFFIGFFLIEN